MMMSQIKSLAILAALAVVVCCVNEAAAQRPRGGFGGRGGGFGGFRGGFGGGPLDLLQREDVQKELELLDDQVAEAKKVGEEMSAKRREVFGSLFGGRGGQGGRPGRPGGGGGAGGGFDPEKIRAAMQDIQKESEEKLSFLLPHQMDRLKQLQIQFQARGRGVLGALASRDVSEKLQISDEQRDELRQIAQGVEEELRKKIAKLRAEAQEGFLSKLSQDQQDQFKDLVGEPFEFQNTGPPRGPGGFGGRGGFGGGRGAGGGGGGGGGERRQRRPRPETE